MDVKSMSRDAILELVAEFEEAGFKPFAPHGIEIYMNMEHFTEIAMPNPSRGDRYSVWETTDTFRQIAEQLRRDR